MSNKQSILTFKHADYSVDITVKVDEEKKGTVESIITPDLKDPKIGEELFNILATHYADANRKLILAQQQIGELTIENNKLLKESNANLTKEIEKLRAKLGDQK